MLRKIVELIMVLSLNQFKDKFRKLGIKKPILTNKSEIVKMFKVKSPPCSTTYGRKNKELTPMMSP